MTGGTTEVYALRYAVRPQCTASEAYHQHQRYGEPDAAIGMDYFFWLIRSGPRTVVVDCGFSEKMGPARGRWFRTGPAELLSRMGADPARVDDVVLTHMHFDHIGNTALFPNARFHVARAELEYWTGPDRDHPAFNWPVETEEVRLVEGLRREERLHLVEDGAEISAGVRADRFPGHTPGQLVVEVMTGDRQVVLAADALHYYDEIDRDRPFYLFTDLAQLFGSYRRLRALDARAGTDVVAGHDPAVAGGYAAVDEDCFDLTAPLDEGPARWRTPAGPR